MPAARQATIPERTANRQPNVPRIELPRHSWWYRSWSRPAVPVSQFRSPVRSP
jgi:hypothetical protein